MINPQTLLSNHPTASESLPSQILLLCPSKIIQSSSSRNMISFQSSTNTGLRHSHELYRTVAHTSSHERSHNNITSDQGRSHPIHFSPPPSKVHYTKPGIPNIHSHRMQIQGPSYWAVSRSGYWTTNSQSPWRRVSKDQTIHSKIRVLRAPNGLPKDGHG